MHYIVRALAEFGLGPKEGIALIQGVPGATGLAVLRLGEAAALTSLMEAAAALSIAVIRAPRDPYSGPEPSYPSPSSSSRACSSSWY